MQLFFSYKIDKNIALLDEVESGHAFRVLRKKAGDSISFVDGNGNFYDGEILEIRKKQTLISIKNKVENWKPLPYHLHIAIAPTKSNDRFEWFLEKATEAGIHQITPLRCKRSERRVIKVERYEKVLKTAMKQSLSANLPKISELTDFQQFITNKTPENEKYFCWCGDENLQNIKSVLKPKKNYLFLIGPEGDFTDDESKLAIENGFQPITFGTQRMRTETAGIFCSIIANFINQ